MSLDFFLKINCKSPINSRFGIKITRFGNMDFQRNQEIKLVRNSVPLL